MPKRPAEVPRAARWSTKDKEWGLGGTRRGNKYVGEWKWWRANGRLVCHSFFDERGEPHGECRRFHPNGELATITPYEHGSPSGIWIGLASTAPTTESWHMVSGMSDRIVRCELDTAKPIPARYRYFLPGDIRCNANGVPLAAKAPSLKKACAPFLHVKSASFEKAIVRGADFLRAARAATKRVDDVFGDDHLVTTGRPATARQLAALAKRYGPLPASWRELLARFGTISVAFAGGPTTPASRVTAESHDVRRTIDEFAEFDDDDDGNVVTSWRKLKMGHGVLLAPKLRAARFLHFAREGASDTHVLAIDWRDSRGECPVLYLPHSEATIVLEAHDALEWLNWQVDHAIEAIVHRTKRLFG